MQTRTKIIGAAAAVAAVAGGWTGVAVADDGGADDRDDTPITGEALDKASAAAIAETGGGKVTDAEVDDEESKYEVEVTLDDGSEVDVQLDEAFAVVGSENDGPDVDGPNDVDDDGPDVDGPNDVDDDGPNDVDDDGPND